MNQREAVIHVMEQNAGYATLAHLYEHTLDIPGVSWKTKTPFASIRRIVQNEKYFFRIQPGLWALNDYKNKLPFSANIDKGAPEECKREFSHSYYQGLLVEIGNLQNLSTFVPAQDQNKQFIDKKLKELITVKGIHEFGYSKFVNVAKTIDVSWFNDRSMPHTFIEVEHTTNFFNSLIKFVELQDYNVDFWIAAPGQRTREFHTKSDKAAFEPIENRVQFLSYEKISNLHSNLYERKYSIGV